MCFKMGGSLKCASPEKSLTTLSKGRRGQVQGSTPDSLTGGECIHCRWEIVIQGTSYFSPPSPSLPVNLKCTKCATCQITCWIASDDNVLGKHFGTFLKAKVKSRLVVNEVTPHSEQGESYVSPFQMFWTVLGISPRKCQKCCVAETKYFVGAGRI